MTTDHSNSLIRYIGLALIACGVLVVAPGGARVAFCVLDAEALTGGDPETCFHTFSQSCGGMANTCMYTSCTYSGGTWTCPGATETVVINNSYFTCQVVSQGKKDCPPLDPGTPKECYKQRACENCSEVTGGTWRCANGSGNWTITSQQQFSAQGGSCPST